MAPLVQALKTHFKQKQDDGSLMYDGNVDPEWTIAAVPHGGYALGLILDATVQSQSSTNQPDICHVTAHYLRSALTKPFIIKISPIRRGRGFSNILAELIQDDLVRISAHLIFTNLPEPPRPDNFVIPSSERLTLTPASPYARLIPITRHPSQATETKLVGKFSFKDRVRWSEDWEFVERRREEKSSAAAGRGEGGLEWAAWMSLKDSDDSITPAVLAFFADMFRNSVELLPKDQKAGPSWFPTMVLAIEFKFKIDGLHAARTVGLWSIGKFMHQGRHDNSVEVWTAPSEMSEQVKSIKSDWRKEQYCLCTSTQMALCLPLSVNEKRREKAKL